MEVKFYRCNHCGNLVMMVHDAGVNPVCCGEKMELLVPGSVDASVEKHVPVVQGQADGLRVEVGSVVHPMTEEHYIELFPPAQGGVVYAYCNLHGLWKAEF